MGSSGWFDNIVFNTKASNDGLLRVDFMSTGMECYYHHVSTAYELGFASAAVVGKIVTLAFCASVHKVLTMGAYWGSGKKKVKDRL